MALQFGKTWWGEHWLRSLTDVDYDLSWNPAVENQATDRAYRIGQQKKTLAEMTVATGEKWLGKLSNRESREIFS